MSGITWNMLKNWLVIMEPWIEGCKIIVNRPEIYVFYRFILVISIIFVLIFTTWYLLWNLILKYHPVLIEIFSDDVVKPPQIAPVFKKPLILNSIPDTSPLTKATNTSTQVQEMSQKIQDQPQTSLIAPTLSTATNSNLSKPVHQSHSKTVNHKTPLQSTAWKDQYGRSIIINHEWF